MTVQLLVSAEEIESWLRLHLRTDISLSAPYRRLWSLAGCEPTRSLATWPTDRFNRFASDLYGSGVEVTASPLGVNVRVGGSEATVVVSRTDLGDGPPTDYGLLFGGDNRLVYITNAPEVVIQVVRRLALAPAPIPECSSIQIGFPGREQDGATYVGSWEWDVHCEARTPEFVTRAAVAIADAITVSQENE